MNAEETISRLKKRYDVTLPSGLNVTIRLPRIRDLILAGAVPLPVMEHLKRDLVAKKEQNGDAPEVSLEQMVQGARYQDEIVRQTLVAIDGEPVEMTLEAVQELEQEDYDALAEYGSRVKSPLPAASA